MGVKTREGVFKIAEVPNLSSLNFLLSCIVISTNKIVNEKQNEHALFITFTNNY